ncbi:lipocalin-like protein [Algoriphagus ratkowskyi]|uniref:Lipocalin-like protein n=1 Tax=Algoriphagus ratkowskyi TaxID=57028 RepID=A0A2W7RQQ5_9BACT|nr:lipocalin family protein [Algoriphagus ratkowskyi]PZX57687.1 lipocalin-like protein [Algoriphagus ratkowskyi]TXD78957.1 hypothetical protein ESW18_05420 [Algoriphagus ratkowskyi]
MKINYVLFLLTFLFIADSCTNKELTNEQKLSGESSKTWTAKREFNAEGDKEKLTREEKKESMTFYSNGKFNMKSGTDAMSGTWTISGDNTLSLVFENSSMSENFQIIKLDDDDARLRAGDGSELVLDAD